MNVFERLFTESMDGIIVMRPGGRIAQVNASACAILGRSEVELRQIQRDDLIDESAEGREAITRLERGATARGAVALKRGDGRTFPAECTSGTITADGDRLTYIIFRDVSDQRELQHQLRELEASSNAQRAELRAALDTAQALDETLTLAQRTDANLRHEQKMEAIGQLAGGVAHDFNNLLTVILGNGELLANVLQDSPLRAEVEEIQQAGKRAAALTRQLLAFSRRQPLQPRVLSLTTLIRNMEPTFARLLGERYEVALILHPELDHCFVDAGQVEQVVLNLVLNARDAMPDGGRITVSTTNVSLNAHVMKTHPLLASGPHVLLAVADTGCGMSAETQAHMFEPFFTTKAAGQGTGLGLSTAYGIVTQSGGNIWVESAPDQGTTVNVYFPCADETAPAEPNEPVALPNDAGHETILLTDDDTLVRSTVAAMLRRAGYRVIEAGNGSEALHIGEQPGEDIALLVTDVVMPRMNGRELADRLRILRPDLQLLFISGYNKNVVVHDGVVDIGINFLQKPLTAELLLPKVREILNRRASDSAP